MTKAEMKSAIDQHACTLDGTLHRFRLQWAATEPRWGRGAKYLLAIEVFCVGGAAPGPATTVHVMTRASIAREQLLHLVEDALNEHLRTGPGAPIVSPQATKPFGSSLVAVPLEQ